MEVAKLLQRVREDMAASKQGSRKQGYARTILDRALNGRDMAALALTGSSYMAIEDYETGLVDALANLMHFARRYEIDFDDHLAQARRHHDAEKSTGWKSTGWDEVPE